MKPSDLYELNYDALAMLRGEDEPLAMIGVFDGFIDAGHSGHVSARHLLDQFPARRLATFDVDELVMLRNRRPAMMFDTTHWDSYTPHVLAIDVLRDGSGLPFLLLHGPEPDLRWRPFVEAVIQVFSTAGASTFVATYGIPMGVPHTRPVPVTVRASDESVIPRETTWLGRMQGPGSVPALLEVRLEEHGINIIGLTAHVPHYLAGASYPAAAQALLTQTERFLDLDLCVERLENSVAEFDRQLRQEVNASPEIAAMIAQLEDHFDASLPGRTEVGDGLGILPSGDEIVREFQQYLDSRFQPPPEAEGWSEGHGS